MITELAQGGPCCFVICPNARNIPAAFLTFGHKLAYGPKGLRYTPKGKTETYACDHLRMTKTNVACTMTELILCSAILDDQHVRFVGNCYGSQVMWVASGGGLTTFSRHEGLRSRATVVETVDDLHVDVRWDDGICIHGALKSGVHMVESLSHYQMSVIFGTGVYEEYTEFLFNTDYHHSFMLIGMEDIPIVDMEGQLGAVSYPWCEKAGKLAAKADFLEKLSKTASRSDEREWIGTYSIQQRIFGFQGHPLYHITEFSGDWNAVCTTDEQGPTTASNKHFENNRRLLWIMAFGFDQSLLGHK